MKYTIIILAILLSACSGARAAAQADATPSTTTSLPASNPAEHAPNLSLIGRLINDCGLLNTQDLANLFSTAEREGPYRQAGLVDHPIFSQASVDANETSCTNYVFHRPGKSNEVMVQVTYWVDLPSQSASSTWTQLWAQSSAQARQPVPGVGDGAFYNNGRLTFKKGNYYVTIGIIDTQLSTDTSPGMNRLIDMEKQLALAALSRFR
jgi:hypothetical protein